MNEIIVATRNEGKIKELEELLHPILCISQKSLHIDSPQETGLSFIENALIKARHVCSIAKKPALADDSGLVVPALGGEPGIYSSRYAGLEASDQENMELLVQKVSPLPPEQRQAYFYCALVLVRYEQDPTPIIATGLFPGYISIKPEGTQGFGYDPLFYLPTYQCTVAQLPATLKNRISHRAKALEQLKSQLSNCYE